MEIEREIGCALLEAFGYGTPLYNCFCGAAEIDFSHNPYGLDAIELTADYKYALLEERQYVAKAKDKSSELLNLAIRKIEDEIETLTIRSAVRPGRDIRVSDIQRYVAFWSYTRFDDKHDEQWLTGLREALVAEVRAVSGKQIEIFQDTDGIAWGDPWKPKLASSSDDAVFLIPIITPSYFASQPCRQELNQFVEREKATGFKDFILPLYYIWTSELEDNFKKATDSLARIVAEHNFEDIKELRHHEINSYEVKQKITQLAKKLVGRLDGYALKQLSSPTMRAHFTAPTNGAQQPRKAAVSGIIENISAGTDVWLVVESGPRYHPQGNKLSTNSTAFEEFVFIGRDNDDYGSEFLVHLLAVTEDISKSFERYRQDASSNQWPGVPKPTQGSRVLATVKVIRNNSAPC